MAKKTASTKKYQRICFCCDKKLGSAMRGKDEFRFPPNDATVWRSYGNYGSTVFDPMNNSFLEAYICDACLVKGKKKLFRARTETRTETTLLHPKDVLAC